MEDRVIFRRVGKHVERFGAEGLHEVSHEQVLRSDAIALYVLASQQNRLPKKRPLSEFQEVSMGPGHVNPLQWHQAVGVARQSCARFFRDGGNPADALKAFGLAHETASSDWGKAVESIAEVLCATPARRAA
jgi:hypothetical protein